MATNPLCQSIPSEVFPNAALCEWFSGQTGTSPQSWDVGETYVDLTDPLKPQRKRKEPDGKISPRELHAAVAVALEKEWQQLFLRDRYLLMEKNQPLAEGLYDLFRFLPPWLPKPLSRMKRGEKDLFNRFLVAVQSKDSTEAIHEQVYYDVKRAVVEDNLLGILRSGIASCVGISNLFYFAEDVVKGRKVEFLEVHRDDRGNQYPHIAVKKEGTPYDPSYSQAVGANYYWFDLDPMDQWALSLMNTGLAKLERNWVGAKRFMERYGLRGYLLAPDYFRVRFNLGVVYYEGGERDIGLHLLRGAKELYPSYQQLQRWEGKLTRRP